MDSGNQATTPWRIDMEMDRNIGSGAVYVQTNDDSGNQVLAFSRGSDGSLDSVGSYATGGKGTGAAHLPSQGSLVVSGDTLLVVNAGSDDVSAFAIVPDGLRLVNRISSGGSTPRSIAVQDDLVYVLNTAAPANVTGFRIKEDGTLVTIPGAVKELSAPDSDPAQVAFSPDGSALVVTERATDAIVVFPVSTDGSLGQLTKQPSSGPTPYGFAFTSTGTLVVTEAFRAEKGKAAASSYLVGSGTVEPVARSVGNGRSEICWAVVSKDDRYAFTTNFADGAVSRYAIAGDGSLRLEDATAGLAVDGQTGLRDEELSSDGRFLYAIDADGRRIYGWEVGENGRLAQVGSWDGLPVTAAGLAAV
jgi:6-phosphogluconolactonase